MKRTKTWKQLDKFLNELIEDSRKLQNEVIADEGDIAPVVETESYIQPVKQAQLEYDSIKYAA